MIGAMEQMQEINAFRVQVGAAKESDVVQLQAQVVKYEENLLILQYSEKDVKRSIELLVGRYPQGVIELASALPEVEEAIPSEIPLSYLVNRPDIMVSQYAVEKAFYELEMTKASRWPSLSLSSNGGWGNIPVLNLIKTPLFTVGGGLVSPIFTWGAIKSNIEIQNQFQQQAVTLYAKSYLTALDEVEGNLLALKTVDQRIEKSEEALSYLGRTYELSQVQFRVGNENMFTLLQKQMQLLNEQTNRLNLDCERLVNRINLYQSIGGAAVLS
ncbi:hypothetical protein PEDI_43740 [Persicobacter diffluens]|uniref:TolC family protein n=2 Tax=Persicobacter diffluens TaxID=981 RepID=A0AAN5AMH7_9BACT|nr:hypothetical protein PEDI_43740 [Persicobacter diffluens]